MKGQCDWTWRVTEEEETTRPFGFLVDGQMEELMVLPQAEMEARCSVFSGRLPWASF